MKTLLRSLLILLFLAPMVSAQSLDIDYSRARKLSTWKPQIQKYSERHYGESTGFWILLASSYTTRLPRTLLGTW